MMKNAIETAIKMETDAIAFYEEAAGKASHPFGKEMFRGFVKDERRHLVMLQGLFQGQDIDDELIRPKETIRTVFSALKDVMMQRVKALESEMEAVRIALTFEKEGFDFYKQAAAHADSEKERKLFERLVIEENDHYSILNETFEFLDNTGHWYMYEERGIIEG
ncbi:MAG: ferritin family protein [Nitrospirae bacterium]|nr:ferritin family protein [Nitrospirota bacterium]